MCPGRLRSVGRVWGSTRASMVADRSAAEIPVVVPCRASTLTVKAVRCTSVLAVTMSGRSSCSTRSGVSGTQISPEVWARKKAIFSGVTASAAMIRSPSFSRSSSSTTTTISPRATAAIALSTVEKGIDPGSPSVSWGREFHPQIIPQVSGRPDGAPPQLVAGGGTGAGEERSGIIPAEQGRGQVQHVAVNQPGGMESVGDPGPPLDQNLQHAPVAEFIEHVAQVSFELQRRLDGHAPD